MLTREVHSCKLQLSAMSWSSPGVDNDICWTCALDNSVCAYVLTCVHVLTREVQSCKLQLLGVWLAGQVLTMAYDQ